MDGCSRYARANEELGHKICMPLRTTECDAAAPAPFAVLLQRDCCASFGRDSCRELRGIKLRVPPRNITIIDGIRDTKVVERAKKSALDSVSNACFKDDIFL